MLLKGDIDDIQGFVRLIGYFCVKIWNMYNFFWADKQFKRTTWILRYFDVLSPLSQFTQLDLTFTKQKWLASKKTQTNLPLTFKLCWITSRRIQKCTKCDFIKSSLFEEREWIFNWHNLSADTTSYHSKVHARA